MVEVDLSKRAKAAERFKSLAGLPKEEAETLVDAALQAAVNQMLDTIMGSGPMPSALTLTRADQLHYVCLQAGRILTQREVGVLFRTTPGNARSIITAASATYEEALHAQAIAEMRSDGLATAIGSDTDGFRWRVKFTQSATYNTAHDELERLGLLPWADPKPSTLTIEFDQTIETPSGQDDILEKLGITSRAPAERRQKCRHRPRSPTPRTC